MILNSKNINNYKIFEISNVAFNDCWNDRKKTMLEQHPNRKEEITLLENHFQKCSININNKGKIEVYEINRPERMRKFNN